MAERLQKILLRRRHRVAPRRRETLIAQGRVSVNGTTVTELGTKAIPTPTTSASTAGASRGAQRRRYLLLYKPRGYITTRSDPEHRPTVIDLLAKGGVREYVYPVGRLDYDSEGLLLLTSDGDLAARLTHPRHGIEREYEVRVRGVPERSRARSPVEGDFARRPADRAGARRAGEGHRGGERPAGAAVVRDSRRSQPAGA